MLFRHQGINIQKYTVPTCNITTLFADLYNHIFYIFNSQSPPYDSRAHLQQPSSHFSLTLFSVFHAFDFYYYFYPFISSEKEFLSSSKIFTIHFLLFSFPLKMKFTLENTLKEYSGIVTGTFTGRLVAHQACNLLGITIQGVEIEITATAKYRPSSPAARAMGSKKLEIWVSNLKQSKPVVCSLHEGIRQMAFAYPILYPHGSFQFIGSHSKNS